MTSVYASRDTGETSAPIADGLPLAAKQNFALIQALRGVAAFWVMLFHANAGGHIDSLKAVLPASVNLVLFDWGHFGVPIFFALSGFVIAHSLRGVEFSWGFLGRFALRRSLRLDPPYWASILLAVAIAILSHRFTGKPLPDLSPGVLIAHVFYVQGLFGLPPLNPVFWTLTYEIQFYLFLVTVLVIGAETFRYFGVQASVVGVWALFLAVAIAASAGLFANAHRGLFLPLWPDFFIGVLAYQATCHARLLRTFLVLVAAILLLALMRRDAFALASGVTALFLFWATAAGKVANGLNWRWLQFLGAISYSLYLTHNSVTGVVGFLLKRQSPSPSPLQALVGLCVIIAGTIGFAALFWRLTELPSHRLSRRIALPRVAPHRAVAVA